MFCFCPSLTVYFLKKTCPLQNNDMKINTTWKGGQQESTAGPRASASNGSYLHLWDKSPKQASGPCALANGTSVGGCSLGPEATQPSQKPLLALSADTKPRGAPIRTLSGREAEGLMLPEATEEAGEAPSALLCSTQAPPAASPPWGVAIGTKGLASGPDWPGRARPSAALERGGQGSRRRSPRRPAGPRRAAPPPPPVALGGAEVGPGRPFPRPPPASPAPLPPGRSRSWCPSAPERGGVGLPLREAGDLNPAAGRAQKPHFPRRFGSRVTPRGPDFRLVLEEIPGPSQFLLSRIPLYLIKRNDKHHTPQNTRIRYWVGDLQGVRSGGNSPLLFGARSPDPSLPALPLNRHCTCPVPPLRECKLLSPGHSSVLRRFSVPAWAYRKHSRAIYIKLLLKGLED